MTATHSHNGRNIALVFSSAARGSMSGVRGFASTNVHVLAKGYLR